MMFGVFVNALEKKGKKWPAVPMLINSNKSVWHCWSIYDTKRLDNEMSGDIPCPQIENKSVGKTVPEMGCALIKDLWCLYLSVLWKDQFGAGLYLTKQKVAFTRSGIENIMVIILSMTSAHLGLVSVLFLHHQKWNNRTRKDTEGSDGDNERYGEVSVEKFSVIFSLENKWLKGGMLEVCKIMSNIKRIIRNRCFF